MPRKISSFSNIGVARMEKFKSVDTSQVAQIRPELILFSEHVT